MKKLLIFSSLIISLATFLNAQSTQHWQTFVKYGEIHKAIEILEKEIKNDSLNCLKMFELGKLYEQTYKSNFALNQYKKISILCIDNIEYNLNFARFYSDEENFLKSDSIYLRVLKADSMNFMALNNLAKNKIRQNKFVDAIEFYNKLSYLDSLNAYYYRRIGYCYNKIDSLDKAEMHYLQALKHDSLEYNSIILLSDLYDIKTQDSLRDYYIDFGLKYFENDARLLARKGKFLTQNQKYLEAIPFYEKAIYYGDSIHINYRQLGLCYLLSASKPSIETLEKAYKLNKEDYTTMFYLAIAYRNSMKHEKSIETFNKAFEIMIPKQISVYYLEQANTYRIMGKYNDALSSYNKVIYYQPDRFDTYIDIAVMYEKDIKDYSKALKYYEIHKKEYTGNDEETIKYIDSKILKMKEELHFRN